MDLEPFLGAHGHAIAVQAYAGGRVFQHAHDMGAASGGGGHAEHGGAMPGAIDSSGALTFDFDFARTGLYRLWVQYRRAGANVTQSFTVRVR